MPAVAWFTIVVAALIVDHRGGPAAGHLPPQDHARDARPGPRRRHRGCAADQRRPGRGGVILAVVALLSLLIYLVKIIDRRVGEVRETLTTAAANIEATS